jgi:hypothetical protein
MIKTTPAQTSAEMTKAQAKAVTDRIRKDIDSAWANITLAYEGKAWKALSYATWEAYVKAEFDMSRRRSYQLLDQGRVIQAVADATGQNVQRVAQISARDVAAVKDNLPAAAAAIKAKVQAGDKPAQATKEVLDAKRAEKEAARKARAEQQAKNDAAREAARAALPEEVKKVEAYKANGAVSSAKPAAGLPAEDRIAELEEAVRMLEEENARLKEENKRFAEMKAEYDRGGFADVIAGKDEVIAVQATRIERESADKASWKRSSDLWRKRAEEAGWSNDVVIDIEPRNPLHG